MDQDLTRHLRRAALASDPRRALAGLVARSGRTPHDVLRTLSTLQDGQFATRQADAAGLTPSARRWLLRSARAVQLRDGVWRWSPTPGSPDRAVTGWLACWPWGTVSHGTAAAHHGLGVAPSRVEVTVPVGRTRDPVGVHVHRTRTMPRHDRLLVAGVPYTSIARTLCDVADRAQVTATLTRVDEAVAAGASRRWLHTRAVALANGRDGPSLVRDATAPGAADEFRSWLERTTADVLRAAGLPPPRWNVPIRDGQGRIGVVDALWPDERVVAELEGLRFHTSPRQRRRDARRFNRLLAAGYVVRRFSWHDVVDTPGDVTATLLRALSAAGRHERPTR